jgi:hypothetical protein
MPDAGATAPLRPGALEDIIGDIVRAAFASRQ